MLFVGRIIPNKRIENVIRFFAAQGGAITRAPGSRVAWA